MAEISRTLGVEPRTVHRHLADEGQSFSAILRATRMGLAEGYLANDGYSLTGVSERLGFASPVRRRGRRPRVTSEAHDSSPR